MAPGKKKSEVDSMKLQLGDLVLAKVKGHPAWPAKISSPKKWEMPPDPKKYFVEFFGTSEIAFVAPADVQVFTKDTKEKLRARCHGKTVKFFAQAVEEICNVFDEKQNKSNRTSPSIYSKKPTNHVNKPVSSPKLTSTSFMVEKIQERAFKADKLTNGKHTSKAKQETKPESSEKEEEDSLSVSCAVPVSRSNLALTIASAEDDISKFPSDDEERETAKKKASEVVDVVIALQASANRKRGRDIPAAGEGSSMQARKKAARDTKGKDSSVKGVWPIKEALKERTPEEKKRSEGSSLMKSRGSSEKGASLSREALQVNKNGKNDNSLSEKGLKVNKEDTGRIKGRNLFNNGPEITTESFSGKSAKTNTETQAKSQGLSETKLENMNVAKELSRIINVHLEEEVQEPKMRDPSEKRRQMEGSAKKKLFSSGPALKKHQSSAEETPPAVKKSKFVGRSGEIIRVETKLNADGSENTDRKRGLVKRSCLFNEGEESEGRRTPVHRKAPLKLEGQKKALLSPQQVKVQEKKGEKTEPREHGNKHVNSEPRTFHSKSSQEGIRVNAKPTHEKGSLLENRLDVAKDEKQDATSMKHLIAVAQARRRETHFHVPPVLAPAASPIQVNTNPPIALSEAIGKQHVSSPANEVPPVILNGSESDGFDNLRAEAPSPNLNSAQRLSAQGGSLSCGTEAAVARDALEGMVETLSRTKESIGRATRLAIDCAKYGIAKEVVDLLVGKLEAEADMHRKVDLFFLIDSITQCSHSQRGVAGSSYIPLVQGALPRILGAAAPDGENARENKRQCLKVLRLWLERRILPEDLLKSCMDEIELPKEEKNPEFLLRRPSRAERSVDDPIREMDGMLVDEYGSNAGFQMPGLFCSNLLAEDSDEEDFNTSSSPKLTSSNNNTNGNVSPLKPADAHNLPQVPTPSMSYEWAPPLPIESPPLPPPLPFSPPPLPVSPPPSTPPPPPPPPESPVPPPPLPESPPPPPPPPPENPNSPSPTLSYYPPTVPNQATYMCYASNGTYQSSNVQLQPSSVPFYHGGPYPQGQPSNPFLSQLSTASYIQQPNIQYTSSSEQWGVTSNNSSIEGQSGTTSTGWVGGVGSMPGSVPASMPYEGYLRNNVEMRPSTNPSIYQPSLHGNVPPNAALPGHQLQHSWRPTR